MRLALWTAPWHLLALVSVPAGGRVLQGRLRLQLCLPQDPPWLRDGLLWLQLDLHCVARWPSPLLQENQFAWWLGKLLRLQLRFS